MNTTTQHTRQTSEQRAASIARDKPITDAILVARIAELEADCERKNAKGREAISALESQERRIAELEAALRYIQTRTGMDPAIQAHIAAALKGAA